MVDPPAPKTYPVRLRMPTKNARPSYKKMHSYNVQEDPLKAYRSIPIDLR